MDPMRTDPLDEKMPSKKNQPQTPIPKSWDKNLKSGIPHVRELDERRELVTAGIDIPEKRLTAYSLDAECQRIDSELCTLEDLLPAGYEYPGDER